MTKIFTTGQDIYVYFDRSSVPFSKISAYERAVENSLEEIRKLKIFHTVVNASTSFDCDIFITLAPIKADFGDGSLIGEARLRAHPSGHRYAQIKLDPRASWSFAPARWFLRFFDKSQRVERWLNHELLHAIGCSHTTEKVSPMPSILDEDNSMDQRPDIPDWDKAYARSLYGLADPHSNQL